MTLNGNWSRVAKCPLMILRLVVAGWKVGNELKSWFWFGSWEYAAQLIHNRIKILAIMILDGNENFEVKISNFLRLYWNKFWNFSLISTKTQKLLKFCLKKASRMVFKYTTKKKYNKIFIAYSKDSNVSMLNAVFWSTASGIELEWTLFVKF